ncbi:XdhC protein [Treponema sp. OMZ 838]|uniref:XdhC family protein n=1 Tax=Treponema sp. OMZ 838 TaxID=1539298 RepID=UPI0005301080|nr:XdhC/CoxI family protein [Treponema sp. OMZ 838]AIW90005.1 XdhC protein [Treponema sp. OMZ 838]
MDTEILKYITADTANGITGVLCTIIEAHGSSPREAGTSMWVTPERIRGTVGGGGSEHEVIKQAREMLKTGDTTCIIKKNLTAEEGLACGGSIQVYLEKIGNDPELFIFGGGHVGRALAKIASFIGFRVTVWDDRADCITEDLFPTARRLCCPLEQLFLKETAASGQNNQAAHDNSPSCGIAAPQEAVPASHTVLQFHENVYCVAVTRGHRCDADVLRYLCGKKLAYIGMIGSFEKNAAVVKLLADEGIGKEYLDSIYKPIGLPIRAETPEEIAVSIAAELIAVRHHGNPALLRRGYTESRHG